MVARRRARSRVFASLTNSRRDLSGSENPYFPNAPLGGLDGRVVRTVRTDRCVTRLRLAYRRRFPAAPRQIMQRCVGSRGPYGGGVFISTVVIGARESLRPAFPSSRRHPAARSRIPFPRSLRWCTYLSIARFATSAATRVRDACTRCTIACERTLRATQARRARTRASRQAIPLSAYRERRLQFHVAINSVVRVAQSHALYVWIYEIIYFSLILISISRADMRAATI